MWKAARRRIAWALAAGLLVPAAPAAAFDAETGQRLAQQWCSNCHAVQPGGGSDQAPAFEVIARKRAETPDYLRTWLSTPHARMPDLGLSRGEIEALVAYLQSLNTE